MKWSGLLIAALAAAALLGPGCTHEWDSYDPRPPSGGASTGGNGGQGGDATSSTLGSGAEGASTNTSSSNGGEGTTGGNGGAGGSGVGGCAPADATGYRAQVLADCPVAYFRVGEATGTSTTDEVGGLVATLTGGPVLGQPGALTSDPDTAVTLDGVNDSICFGDMFDFGPQSFTVELWMMPSLLDNAYRRAYAKETGAGTPDRTGFLFWVRQPDPTSPQQTAMSFEVWATGTKVTDTPLLTPPKLATWIHLVTRADVATQKAALFLDGVLVMEDIDAGTTVDNAGAFCWGSTSTGSANFGGSLDEMAIYDHALTDARIAAHHQAARN